VPIEKTPTLIDFPEFRALCSRLNEQPDKAPRIGVENSSLSDLGVRDYRQCQKEGY
jgi:hypothetical protein